MGVWCVENFLTALTTVITSCSFIKSSMGRLRIPLGKASLKYKFFSEIYISIFFEYIVA